MHDAIFSHKPCFDLDSSQTHFLTALYLVMGGSILYYCGLLLWQNFNADVVTAREGGLYVLVQWVGCAESVLFVVGTSWIAAVVALFASSLTL